MTVIAKPHSSTPGQALAELQGAWRMRELDVGGSKGAPGNEVTWTIQGEELVIRHGGIVQATPGGVGFALVAPAGGGAGKVNYAMRLAGGSGLTMRGTYTTDGDTLSICFCFRGVRPDGCESGPDRVLYTFERVADSSL